MCGCGKTSVAHQSSSSGRTMGTTRALEGANTAPVIAATAATAIASATLSVAPHSFPSGRLQELSAIGGQSTAMHQANVALRYRGAQAVLVRGPVSGTSYSCYPGDTISAHPRDVPPLVASGLFLA